MNEKKAQEIAVQLVLNYEQVKRCMEEKGRLLDDLESELGYQGKSFVVDDCRVTYVGESSVSRLDSDLVARNMQGRHPVSDLDCWRIVGESMHSTSRRGHVMLTKVNPHVSDDDNDDCREQDGGICPW